MTSILTTEVRSESTSQRVLRRYSYSVQWHASPPESAAWICPYRRGNRRRFRASPSESPPPSGHAHVLRHHEGASHGEKLRRCALALGQKKDSPPGRTASRRQFARMLRPLCRRTQVAVPPGPPAPSPPA